MNVPSTTLKELQEIEGCLASLRQGLASIVDNRSVSLPSPDLSALEDRLSVIERFFEWKGKIQPQRMRELAFLVLKDIYRLLEKFVKEGREIPHVEKMNGGKIVSPFLGKAAAELGPVITFSADHMTLFIKICKDMAHLWSDEEVLATLEKKGFALHVDRDELKNLFVEKKYGQLVRIGSGTPPRIGKNATLQYAFHLYSPEPEWNREEDDRQNEEIFKIVKIGQAVIRKVPATVGECGRDLLGNEIPGIRGLDVDVPKIPHCEYDPKNLKVYASVQGIAYRDRDQIILVPAHIEKRDLVGSADNLKKRTAIAIEGDVKEDCVIESASAVAIDGIVESAAIKANDFVMAQNGIEGKNRARISSEREVRSRFIHQADVQAKDRIVTYGAIIHSTVSAKHIYAFGKNGQLIGGKIQAWDDVRANVIGSDVGVETLIELGNELPTLQEEKVRLKTEIEQKQEQLKPLMEKQKKLLEVKKKTGTLLPSYREEYNRIQSIAVKIKDALTVLQSKLDQVRRDLQYSKECVRSVRVFHTVYPGTIICISEKSLKVKSTLGPTIFRLEKGRIITEPYPSMNP
ncbi:MAG: DUF342 domain-containing protein [Candidatus Omnitrophota bacterium]|jgi:uncharacterized protein (DUF342 family)|nr:MAG: DUF342 domain-containing protein [Candidatus Omnitrophota bacterium]